MRCPSNRLPTSYLHTVLSSLHSVSASVLVGCAQLLARGGLDRACCCHLTDHMPRKRGRLLQCRTSAGPCTTSSSVLM